MSAVRVLTGDLLDFRDDPRTASRADAVRHQPDGAIAIDGDGRIAWRGALADMPIAFKDLPRDDYWGCLILPGLIDTHTHFPQVRMLAAPGKDLLDWLNRFTFAEEARYCDRTHAAAAAETFLDRFLANGTTTAVAYASSHKQSAEMLFEAAERRRMAMHVGKVMMDCGAPREVLDTPEDGARETEELIQAWHRKGRQGYAITLRFAVTSTEAQLAACGELVAAYPDCAFQTHLSESAGEIAAVAERFPWAKDYTDVYDRYGLLTDRGLFGHAIHLSERECARLSETGSIAVHCPTSNTFLGSGLFDIDHIAKAGRPVRVGLATDVGGGTSYSMLVTMGEAHKVAILNGRAMPPLEAFHMATRGNAIALKQETEIGTLEPGSMADIAVLDPVATPVLASRHELSETLEDVLFALMLLGDDRAVRATYVAGKPWKGGAS